MQSDFRYRSDSLSSMGLGDQSFPQNSPQDELSRMTTFAALLRSYRLRAGLGLRTFAGLIDERASTVSAIESHRRAPWRQAELLHRVAEVLGIAETSELWGKFCDLAQHDVQQNHEAAILASDSMLDWWWTTEAAPPLGQAELAELADFVGTSLATPPTAELNGDSCQDPPARPALTELAIEWRVRRLLGRRNSQLAPGPVDVEAVLENEAGVRLEIVPGLIPRFSVQACIVECSDHTTLYVDRIVADSRPLASYRHLLAKCYAIASLWSELVDQPTRAIWLQKLRASDTWTLALRDCERFALALLLPANPVLAESESVYRELVEQQGWVEDDVGTRWVRNRLAERFAVPPTLVHRRLVGWPCHLYGRIAQALAAQEPTLPPTDWFVDDEAVRQQTLFDLDLQSLA